MARGDDLLRTIEAVHAAGLDETRWPDALAATATVLGGNAAMMEVFAPPSQRPVEFHSFGIPPTGELAYFEHYAALSPRAAYAFRHPGEPVLWDYKFIDERAMDRDPYYTKLLPQSDLRYFISAKFIHTADQVAAVSVQRTRRQGHAGSGDIALMKRLAPHFRQAFDTVMRLRRAHDISRSFESALDWLADGIALLSGNGTVLYANEAMQAMLRRNDGIAMSKRTLTFASSEARDSFAKALRTVASLKGGDPNIPALHDFPAGRPSNAPPYLIALRPLTAGRHRTNSHAAAILFIRDPSGRRADASGMLRAMFGLTEAEASLAQALQAGRSPAEYASGRSISLNTVYTHLRRVKEKTGCKRMTELIRKLNDLQVPLRIV